ncbi:MAG: xanthine dehydrogenase family protein molybdopterin-binding subunit [Planctomycetota bacterium]|jgi:xanthine dehydrogenase YagR molybdenum-binding subunit
MSDKKIKLGFPGNEREINNTFPADAPPAWGADAKLSVVGKDHPRVDARLKATGKAVFSFDRRFEGMVYAKMLRCPHAAATVKRIDITKAQLLAGVVFAEAEQGKRIRYAGEHVAGVAAETEEILDDALRLIEVEYEVLPHAVTIEDARAPSAPPVMKGPNERPGRPRGNAARVAEAHKAADAVLEREYRTQVQTHSCLETHGTVCVFKDGKLTVYASTQGTFSVRGNMARAMGLNPNDVTVVTEHMGGGFGSKFGADAWDHLCARVARKTGRPCRLLLDRREEHMIAGNRPDSIQKCKFSVKKDGTLMGAEVSGWGTAGVSARGAGAANPTIYKFKATRQDMRAVVTNAGRGRAFRAPGHPQGVFALEGMIDELAEAIGMDPLALRKKNDPHPVRQAQYDVGAKAIGWDRRKESGSDKGVVKRGIGMAASRWHHSGRPNSAVRCRIEKNGTVLVANGAQDIGTGTRTVLAILAAEELGLTPDRITVRMGNTQDPIGPASGGSTTTPTLTPPTRLAVVSAKRELLGAVADVLGGDAAKMDLKDGKVVGAAKPLTFAQACALMPGDVIEVQKRAGRELFHAQERFAPEVGGVQFAEVEVDTGTGGIRVVKVVGVHDCGRVVNALAARSQINGGIIQGVSYALLENRVLDRGTGNMLNANFVDYKFAGSLDTPEIDAIPFPVANGITPSGVSSLGEPATVPTAAAVANAVANAIGARVRSLPITPDKVLKALGELA